MATYILRMVEEMAVKQKNAYKARIKILMILPELPTA